MVEARDRQKVKLIVIWCNHYQAFQLFYPNQRRNKFEKKFEESQNLTIFENFQLFFKIFFDSVTIITHA